MPLMPALFIGHGSPMDIVEDNAYTRDLARLAAELPRPDAILVISAHRLTEGSRVLAAEFPRTIHDFLGFPEELYDMTYLSPGAPALAEETARLTGGEADEEWGLDHASWSPLSHMYPDADIPVFEMSLDVTAAPREHYELGRKLAPLRERGDDDALVEYERLGPEADLAMPTNDHYLPMLYALAMRAPGEPLTFTHEGVQNGSVSMRCFRVG